MDALRNNTQPVCQYKSVTAFRCPAQVLVVDRPYGPAHILMDSISRLLEGELAFTLADECHGVWKALDHSCFDLVVVGLDRGRIDQLSFLPQIRDQYPTLSVMLVGNELTRQRRQWARYNGVDDVVEMPRRAADMRALLLYMAAQYLNIV